MEAQRLLTTDEASWALAGPFWTRVESFVARYRHRCKPASVVYDIQTRWTRQPNLTGLWIACDDGKPYAHLASWIADYYGVPFVFIAQAECDPGYKLGPIALQVLDEIDKWAATLNAAIPAGSPTIDYVEMATWRDAATWQRYLERRSRLGVEIRSVIEFPILPSKKLQ